MNILTILCGGRSQRMGQDKAQLCYRGETLLERHIRLAGMLPIRLHIAGADNAYALPPNVYAVPDALAGRQGPFSALVGALQAAAAAGADGTWLMPVDTLISPAAILAALPPSGASCVMLEDGGMPQPLFAYYRTVLLPQFQMLLAAGARQMLPLALLDGCRQVPMPAGWRGMAGFNTPEQWQAAQQLTIEDIP